MFALQSGGLAGTPGDDRAASVADFANKLRGWAAIHELARVHERPEVASLMLDCAVKLRGAARAYDALAGELANPTPDEDEQP